MVAVYLEWTLLVVVFAPLAGVLINSAGYKLWSDRLSGWIGCLAVVVPAVLSWLLFARVESGETYVWTLYTWIQTDLFHATIGLHLDRLSGLMLIVVTTVSACVHVYSLEYMEGDEGFKRFFIFLNLFVFSMNVLVAADNLLMMFIGWEGVGLCSYLLIGFWYDRASARLAGRKAFIVNRVGDLCFLVGIFTTILTFGSLQFQELARMFPAALHAVGPYRVGLIALLFFGGAVGKSAQFPLYVWLPDAMEGPTPVSSLIHAATMVTAGVYMIARLHFLYAPGGEVLGVGYIVAFTGAFTALFAATMALVHPDMKRILAYSTVSQLGYMFTAVGVGAFGAGVFHLVTHAFFKGLLFLMAGSVMHALHGELNIFKMGGLSRSMPLTAAMAVVGGLGLSGFPLLAGFWSKDEILLGALGHGHWMNWVLFLVLAAGALLTAFYTFRMVFVAFWGSGSTEAHEPGWEMGLPMVLLAVGTVGGGLFGFWTEGLPEAHLGHPSHLLVTTVSVLAVGTGVLGAYLTYQLGRIDPERWAREWEGTYELLANQYYVDPLYETLFVRPTRRVARGLWRIVDDLLIDGLVDLTGGMLDITGLLIRFGQTGYIRHYLMFVGLALLALLSGVSGWMWLAP